MSRQVFPFVTGDVSALAQSLRRQMAALAKQPSHLELMNMLARGAGFRNFQHFRADAHAKQALDAPLPPCEPVDHTRVARVSGHFTDGGVLKQWPSKTSHQQLAMWVLWSRFPKGETLTETDVNVWLLDLHRFHDPALIRREMVNRKLLGRTSDGRRYWRIEQKPPADAIALIRRIETRRQASA